MIDTADVYSGGASEQLVGRWRASRPEKTSRLVVATKARFGTGPNVNDAGTSRPHLILMQRGGREFLTDVPISFQTYEEEKIDIHHIFPQRWCKQKENGVERKRMDSIINKTAISSRTNRIIGGAAPSKYLLALEKRGQINIPAMDQILATHLIASPALRADNFEAFFEARRQALMQLIGEAMGKAPAAAAELSEPTGEPVDDEDDTDDDIDIVEAA